MSTADPTERVVPPGDQGIIPPRGPNPPGGEQALFPGGRATGGGGPPLADGETGTCDVGYETDLLAPGAVQHGTLLDKQTKGAQQIGQENGTPSNTNQDNVGVQTADDCEEDVATVHTDN